MELMLFFKDDREFLGILHSNGQIINIDCNVLIEILPFFLNQISGSALQGKNPTSIMQLANLSSHLAPLLHRP
jgi:hypothetical protein